MDFEFRVYTPEGATLLARVTAKSLDDAVDSVYSGDAEFLSVDVAHLELLHVAGRDGDSVYLRSRPDVD
jgi:hypothetical protein